MHTLIRCARSINNTLLLPLKYLLAESASWAIISTLSDLDWRLHCCSLRPYRCSLEGYKPQNQSCFTFLLFSTTCSMNHCAICCTVCSRCSILQYLYIFTNISKLLQKNNLYKSILDAARLPLSFRGIKRRYFLFQFQMHQYCKWQCTHVERIQLPNTVSPLVLSFPEENHNRSHLCPLTWLTVQTFCMDMMPSSLYLLLTVIEVNFALCLIIDASFLTHISLCCDHMLTAFISCHQDCVTAPYSFVRQISRTYLSRHLAWMFNTHNQGHCTSCLPFLSLNLETWHFIYLLHGLETIYKTG